MSTAEASSSTRKRYRFQFYDQVIPKFPRKISSCLQEILGFKISDPEFPRLGEFEPKFPEEILGVFLVKTFFFPQEIFDPSNPKISWKIFVVRNGQVQAPRKPQVKAGYSILGDIHIY